MNQTSKLIGYHKIFIIIGVDNYNFNFDTKKLRQASPIKNILKFMIFFCLLHGSTYVELNKICL